MKNNFQFRRRHGFSLLEVLVAVAVLSFGLLALATLQISVMRDSSDTKSRSVALSIAKDRLERLRRYTTLAGYQALADTTGADVVVGGVSYSPSWAITRYVFNEDVDADGILSEPGDQQFQVAGTETGVTPASPAGFVDNNEFKQIKVAVTWQDATAVTQTVAMEDAVAALAPTDGALVAKSGVVAVTRRIPAIIKDPALDAMVIPIALGGGINSAATNPKPQVVVGTSVVETQFDVYTYANLTGGTATAQARVETVMLGCTCDYGTADATAFNKRPTYWDGFRYTVPLAATHTPAVAGDYTAKAGVAASFVNLQSPRCVICCRDHHDPVGVEGATFSPRLVTKSVSNIVTSKHPHYFDKAAADPAETGTFKEACRLIRVDGIFRVATDLSNDYFGLLATGNGTTAANAIPDSTSVAGDPPVKGAVARYQKFVLGYLGGRFVTPTPSDSTAKGTYNSVGTPNALAATAPYVLDNPTSIAINLAASGKWLHSRGLYVDYIEQENVDAIKAAKLDAGCPAGPALTACVLKLLPFTSVNLTEIADWSPLTGPPIRVDNNNYSTSLTAADPVRGQVTSNASAAVNVNVTTSSRRFNSGLLDLSFDSISAADNVPLTDVQVFAIGGGSPPSVPGNGSFPVTVSYGGTNTVSVSYFTTGTAATRACGGVITPFSCTVDNGSATVGLDADGGISIDVGGYNHKQSNAGQTTPQLTGCTGTGNAAGVGFAVLSSGTSPYSGSVCKNYQVTAVTTTTPLPGIISWALAPSSLADGRVNPYPGEVTRISFTGKVASIAPNTVAVTLGLQATTTQAPSSCTYVCGNGSLGPPSQTNNANNACKSSTPAVFTAIFPACP